MLSIVISWRDRVQLGDALPSLVAAAQRAGGDVTVVDYGGDPAVLRRQLTAAPVAVVHVTGEQYFNKARAQNLGAANTTQPVLFFCDCDIVVEPDAIAALAAEVAGAPGAFATIAGVRESVVNARQAGNLVRFGYQLDLRLANGRRLQIIDHEEDAETGARQAPGLLIVKRSDFTAIQGYNGRLHGWGWEDQDMIARLTLGAGLTRIQRAIVTHLSHGDDERMAHYPQAASRWESRDRMFRQALALYDAGDLDGTYEADRGQLRHERTLVTSAAPPGAP
jgi:hypothetical protein